MAKLIPFLLIIVLNNLSFGSEKMREALYYKKINESVVQCELCPRKCLIRENQKGYCTVRKNVKGKLYSLVYGKPVSIAVDPIEKKPVFHLLPGSKSFSLATVGCNLRCIHCQNWQISQTEPENVHAYDLSPAEIVKAAIKEKCESISYTYTEPTVYYEYMLDIAKLAKQKGIKNVVVTAGYINPEPLKELCKYIDVYRVDLKGFSEEFYRKISAADLSPVLDAIKITKEQKVWVEIINLIIPGYNDDMDEIKKMCIWIKKNVGDEVPLYFSRFTPQHKLAMIPMTPIETLNKARKIAKEVGLKFVYIGNVPGHEGENTYCPNCEKIIIKRSGFFLRENNLKDGKCRFCSRKIPGIWK